jgi:preprotein translocase subunit SecG
MTKKKKTGKKPKTKKRIPKRTTNITLNDKKSSAELLRERVFFAFMIVVMCSTLIGLLIYLVFSSSRDDTNNNGNNNNNNNATVSQTPIWVLVGVGIVMLFFFIIMFYTSYRARKRETKKKEKQEEDFEEKELLDYTEGTNKLKKLDKHISDKRYVQKNKTFNILKKFATDELSKIEEEIRAVKTDLQKQPKDEKLKVLQKRLEDLKRINSNKPLTKDDKRQLRAPGRQTKQNVKEAAQKSGRRIVVSFFKFYKTLYDNEKLPEKLEPLYKELEAVVQQMRKVDKVFVEKAEQLGKNYAQNKISSKQITDVIQSFPINDFPETPTHPP